MILTYSLEKSNQGVFANLAFLHKKSSSKSSVILVQCFLKYAKLCLLYDTIDPRISDEGQLFVFNQTMLLLQHKEIVGGRYAVQTLHEKYICKHCKPFESIVRTIR